MRLAIVGANGRTGRETVARALGRGHQVTALARQQVRAAPHPQLDSAVVDVLDPDRVTAALAGVDAVISAVAVGRSGPAATACSRGVANLLEGMARHRIDRIVAVSAMPAGPRRAHPPFERFVVLPLWERFFGTAYRDLRRMEQVLANSAAGWTSVRPPRLVDKPAYRTYRISLDRPLARARTITYPDLAIVLLDALDHDQWRGRAAYVAN